MTDPAVAAGRGPGKPGRRAGSEDVRQSYPRAKAEYERVHGAYSYYVWGPVAIRLAPVFINAGASANQVTALGLVTLALAVGFVVAGGLAPWNLTIGAVLVNGVYLLDCVDGHVARVNRQASRLGALLDDLVGWLRNSSVPIAFGVAFWLRAPAPPFGVEVPAWAWPALGFVRAVLYLLSVVVWHATEGLLGPVAYRERASRRIPRLGWLALAKAALQSEPLVLVAAALTGTIGSVFVAYGLAHCLARSVAILCDLRDTASLDRASAAAGEPGPPG
jgi:phosphatidylglycerophosphate synthase